MKTAFAALLLAGAIAAPASAQTDVESTIEQQISKEAKRDAKQMERDAKILEKEMKALEWRLNSPEFALRLQKDAMRTLDLNLAELNRTFPNLDLQIPELNLQIPVPPVAPVPPKDPRQKPRDRERRRIPEGWVESTEPFTRTFNVGKGAVLLVTNVAGNIQVTPGAADRIEVEALKHAWGPNAEQAKARLGDSTVEAYASGNRVEVRVEHGGRNDPRNVEVEFNVKVPPDGAVDLRTVSGDIRVTNVRGEVRVQGISGNLGLEGTTRVAMVKTVSGDVTLTNVGADALLSLTTINGDVLAQTVNARSIDVNTVNGDVRIAGWAGDRAQIRTLDGDLELQASLVKGGRYEIESHSGDIQLSLPEQPGFELETHTFSGRIRIDFPIKSEGPIRDNDRGPRSIRGTYGDASSSLRVQTFSGDLTVTRR